MSGPASALPDNCAGTRVRLRTKTVGWPSRFVMRFPRITIGASGLRALSAPITTAALRLPVRGPFSSVVPSRRSPPPSGMSTR